MIASMILRPVDLLRLRDDLVAFAATDIAAKMRALDIEHQRLPAEPVAESMRSGMAALAASELFYVSPEMCELASTAAQSLPEFVIAPDGPPALAGLAWFGQPIEDDDGTGRRFFTVAMSWYVVGPAVRISCYVDRDRCPADVDTTVLQARMPQVFPMGCWESIVDETGTSETMPNGSPGTAVLSTLKTLWLLMRQPLADDHAAEYDRASRRRFQREGVEPPPVRVIALRRPAGSSTGGTSDAEWHHQWIVRGHWRQQPYGVGRAQRRPTWISPHVKGPEGAPLLGGQKVYTVNAEHVSTHPEAPNA